MTTLQGRWREWDKRFAALSRRERLTLAIGVILAGAFLIFSLGIDPHLARLKTSARALAAAQTELAQQRGLAGDLKRQSFDPDAGNRTALEGTRKELAAINARLTGMESGMVPPERMREFLDGLLARNRGVELLSVKTHPPTLVGAQASRVKGETAADPAGAGAPVERSVTALSPVEGIYQHGIEIRLAGNYNDLLNYLVALERLPQRVLWTSVSLTVERYPRSVLVLRLNTLSLDPGWLKV